MTEQTKTQPRGIAVAVLGNGPIFANVIKQALKENSWAGGIY